MGRTRKIETDFKKEASDEPVVCVKFCERYGIDMDKLMKMGSLYLIYIIRRSKYSQFMILV